uniref:TSA: Wollemia nobilis Ref_Wollemi_Transcript_15057_2802 transcribed RNA sequence n=1 Tax=Wollemia nobilis TaxID=56998 RepID=A0A0C9S6F1_9CONI
MALVVKVKYEGTLRRFNAFIKEDGSLDLSLDGLRSKISELFHFSPNAQFVITYVDEDNDIVTMVDDSDLLDAFGQGLNPLRVQVSLTNQNNRGTERRSPSIPSTPRSIPSTPRNDEHVQAFDISNICSDETLKLLPEPAQKTLMKFVKDCPVLSSSAAVSEFVQGITKLVSTQLGPLLKNQGTTGEGDATQWTNSVPASGEGDATHRTNSVPTATNDAGVQRIGYIQAVSNDRAGPSAPPVDDPLLKRNRCFEENMHRTFHKGIQCDGCGMNPIIGPRFKSTVKEDYDLCQGCYCEIGNEDDYTRIDRALYRPPRFPRDRPFHGRGPFHKMPSPPFSRCPYIYSAPCPPKPANKVFGKLDCRFVQDVTIFDGTQLAPETPFTKIWRLRNNGTVPWPQHTQLVRVGGDDLGAGNAVSLEIQEQGYPVDQEIDAAVDLVAPMQPGRYVSYWRLMAPSGQKFGQRVWVLIQVETQKEELPHLMDLLTLKDADQNNLSQEQNEENKTGGAVFPQATYQEGQIMDDKTNFVSQDGSLHESGRDSMVDVSKGETPFFLVEAVDASTLVHGDDVPTVVQGSSSMNTESMSSALGANSLLFGKQVPVNDVQGSSMMNAEYMASALGPKVFSSGKPVPVNDVSADVTMSASAPSLLGSGVSLSVGRSAGDVAGIEQKLLHELEDMGFKHKRLNVEVLRKNNNDIQKTLDDLCAAAEWDPILEELQEMGFNDTEMNRKLLAKNEGSVKRVVLDLLSAEKDASVMQSHLSKKAKQS